MKQDKVCKYCKTKLILKDERLICPKCFWDATGQKQINEFIQIFTKKTRT